MDFKIDTKEKFHVITIEDSSLHANMTDILRKRLNEVTENRVKHIILNLKNVTSLAPEVAAWLVAEQEQAAIDNRSFVICELQKSVKAFMIEQDVLDVLNVTPTESEAWDIVQMEEVERELLGE